MKKIDTIIETLIGFFSMQYKLIGPQSTPIKRIEKSEGKIVTIQIISSISKDKYIDTVENFDKLLNYLLKNVEKEKMECYILGTKEEAEI